MLPDKKNVLFECASVHDGGTLGYCCPVAGKHIGIGAVLLAAGAAVVWSVGMPDGCGGGVDEEFVDGGPGKCTPAKIAECSVCQQACDPRTGGCLGRPCGGDGCSTCTANGCEWCKRENCEFCVGGPGGIDDHLNAYCANSCDGLPGECKDGTGNCGCERDEDCNRPHKVWDPDTDEYVETGERGTCNRCNRHGECVSACDADNCEHCSTIHGPPSEVPHCRSYCGPSQNCDGHRVCSYCDPACNHLQCQTCIDDQCVDDCPEGTTCDGNGECVQACRGAKPNACSECVNGSWVDTCTKDGCSRCNGETGKCESTCKPGEVCVRRRGGGMACIKSSNACEDEDGEPLCDPKKCQECVQSGFPPRHVCGNTCTRDQICYTNPDLIFGICRMPCPANCDGRGDDDDECTECDEQVGACRPCTRGCTQYTYTERGEDGAPGREVTRKYCNSI